MIKYNFNIVNEDFDFGKAAKRAANKQNDEISKSIEDSLLSLMSPSTVIKDMFNINKLYGFNEVNVDSINRKSYEVIVKDAEHGTVHKIKDKLQIAGWTTIERYALDVYFADDNILKGECASITNQHVKEQKESLVLAVNKPVSNKYALNAKAKLNNAAILTAPLDKNPELRSFIIDVINYVHYDVPTCSLRTFIMISPDNGIVYAESYLGEDGYKCIFVLTCLVKYKNAVDNNKPVSKQDKRDELILRRICTHYKIKISNMSMHAARIDGHIVLKASYNYKPTNNKYIKDDYEFIGKPGELYKIDATRWFRVTYNDGSKVLQPKWRTPEGEVIKCYRASGDTADDTAGLIVWYEIIPDETRQAGICNAYIGLTGDITYDSKTGKPLYNNILNISY